ncbi:MAG: hypothetical protein JF595_12010, partial [Sphingomonadales bacterium]|nr:hypothetical protein [Sphingomonadales bacterium]
VATALIRSPLKTAYNDANPTVDASGQYKDEEAADLKELFNGLGDDLTALGLKLCARTS